MSIFAEVENGFRPHWDDLARAYVAGDSDAVYRMSVALLLSDWLRSGRFSWALCPVTSMSRAPIDSVIVAARWHVDDQDTQLRNRSESDCENITGGCSHTTIARSWYGASVADVAAELRAQNVRAALRIERSGAQAMISIVHADRVVVPFDRLTMPTLLEAWSAVAPTVGTLVGFERRASYPREVAALRRLRLDANQHSDGWQVVGTPTLRPA